jgi:alkylresorcinol/alkylpyrone synthase
MKTILRGLSAATAPLYAAQEEAYEFFTAHCALKPAEQDLYRRILLDGRIKGRYLGMDAKTDALDTDPDRLLARFLKFGRTTAVAATHRALAEAGVETTEIAGLIVNTCTGYLCPGLSSYAARRSRISKPPPACLSAVGKARFSAWLWRSVRPPFSQAMNRT